MIESVQNKRIKELCRLHQKKYRDQTNTFLVEGLHMIEEAKRANCLEEVFLIDQNLWQYSDISYTLCSQNVLDKLSLQKSNASIIGLCKKPQWSKHSNEKVLLLDDVQDPGNLGTLVRSAYALGIQSIYCSRHCADLFNPKTIQATQGALFHIPVYYTDLLDLITKLKNDGITVYATGLQNNATMLQDTKIASRFAIVLGNEGQGVHKEIQEAAHRVLQIEMAQFESLNVAVAGGILMYTCIHQGGKYE